MRQPCEEGEISPKGTVQTVGHW